ncbi:MAG: hypothetical protein IPJ28_11095 [Betaproteobacteria bacterium]|nr:hypothetical protein [Betaproteobacteria bacterium]
MPPWFFSACAARPPCATGPEQREYGAALDGDTSGTGAQDLNRHPGREPSYRFTPSTTGTIVAARQKTHGLSAAGADTRQTYYSAALATDLGVRTTASAGVRRTDFESSTAGAGYRENAVFAQLSVRF